MGHLGRQVQHRGMGLSDFMCVLCHAAVSNCLRFHNLEWIISQANEWEEYSSYFGKGVGISRNWAMAAHFLTFMIGLGIAMEPVSVSFS